LVFGAQQAAFGLWLVLWFVLDCIAGYLVFVVEEVEKVESLR